jgi:hypothetical protein
MAQENSDTVLVRITTVDGNEYLGNIVSEDLDKVVFKTQNIGQITLDVRDIRSRERVYKSQIKEGKLWFVNPQASRYFWSPNGYGLRKGEGYYHNIWVLWNQFAYGLTNNFSIGGGIIPTFLFAGAPTPVFITPKFSIPLVKEKFNLGGGAILGTILGESESGFGIVYGLTTYGSRDNNMTLGVGYGFAGGEWAQRPLINLNGMARLSNRMYFLSENYYMRVDDENLMIFSLGGRWIIKKAAVDFGLFIPAGSEVDEFVALPWLGFTIPFGKK